MEQSKSAKAGERRDFFKKAAALIIGGITGLFPALAGLTVLFDPLRRKAQEGGFIRVTSMVALPNDGVPKRFAIIADSSDAWNKFPQVPVGAVYLRRSGESTVQAFNVVCPHAGCSVDFVADRGYYLCPCHNSSFAVDGSLKDRSSPSRRGLDSLDVEIRNGAEVWVKFQNFRAGHKEKLPVA